METAKFKWYVYELIDPRIDKPFYVGKGTGSRIDHHEKEAAKGVCSRKCNLIRELHKNNLVVGKKKIAFFNDEEEAYAFEESHIASIGLKNLTNVMPGGGSLRLKFSIRRRMKDRFTPDNCMKAIEIAKDWFANWLRNMDKQATVEFRHDTNLARFQKKMLEFFYNSYARRVFAKAAEDQSNHQRLTEIFRPYKITLQFS
jgi:hypothetical protein